MSTFKVGDKVRIVKRDPTNQTGSVEGWNQPNGNVGAITKIKSIDECGVRPYHLEDDKYYGFFQEHEIEHVFETNFIADWPGTISSVSVNNAWDNYMESFRQMGSLYGYPIYQHYSVENTNKPKKTIMKTISNYIKKTLNAETQELLKAGLINGDLEPTVSGIYELNQILWFANLAALVTRAKEINAEAEAEAKKR